MTDATRIYAGQSAIRRVADSFGEAAREAFAGLKSLPSRTVALFSNMREERDFDRIHDALSRLNKRQLAMMGLRREEIYTFAELCVYQPERRPVLALYEAGPSLSLPAPERAALDALLADQTPPATPEIEASAELKAELAAAAESAEEAVADETKVETAADEADAEMTVDQTEVEQAETGSQRAAA
ncbi:MAG: hypothetical protein AAF899_15640 [Pseudomonadota bacterium]